MTSRLKTGDDLPRPLSLSRRAAFAGTSALPLMPQLVGQGEDLGLTACKAFLNAEAETWGLYGSWSRLESHLHRTIGWIGLPEKEKQTHPAAKTFAEIEARQDVAHQKERAALEVLLATPPTTWAATIASLKVLLRLITKDDHKEANLILRRVLGVLAPTEAVE